MNRFVLIIICLYIVVTPFYVFPSGLPQPADLIVAMGGGVFLLNKKFYQTLKYPIFKWVQKLLLLIIVVNCIHWFYLYAINGIENKMYFIPLYYLFNLLFMVMIVYVVSQNNSKYNNIILFAILISLSIQFALALLGIEGWNKDEEVTGRPSLFFNNPNQLGYYALAIITLFFIIPSKYKKNLIFLISAIFFSSYLILYSGSRAALAGVLLLSFYVLYKEGFKLNVRSILLVIVFFVSIPFMLNSEFVEKRLNLIETRSARNETGNVTEAQIRGYDRIYLNPEYLFFGAGEGKNDRFISYHQLEIHSGFGTVLFSYGFIGLFLFLMIIYEAIKANKLIGIIFLLPIIVYNVTHNGLRNSMFWAILGVLSVVLFIETKERKYE